MNPRFDTTAEEANRLHAMAQEAQLCDLANDCHLALEGKLPQSRWPALQAAIDAMRASGGRNGRR